MDEQNTPSSEPHNPEPVAETKLQESSAATNSPKGNAGVRYALVVAVVIVLVAVGYRFWGTLDPCANAVACVNGAPITTEEYQSSYEGYTRTLSAQGINTSDPQYANLIKEQVIEGLISTTLLLGAANAENVTLADGAVDAELARIAAQFESEEAMDAQMVTLGITREQLESDIREQLLIRAYLDAHIDDAKVAVTDEEIVAFYDANTAGLTEEEKPLLADVSVAIQAQLVQQKELAEAETIVAELKGAAEIVRNI